MTIPDMTQRPYSYYNVFGEITMTAECAAVAVATGILAGHYAGAIEGIYDPNRFYVLDGIAVPRQDMPIIVDGNILRNVPAGADVTINSRSYTAEGGDIELSFTQAGKKEIAVRLFPFRDWTATYAAD